MAVNHKLEINRSTLNNLQVQLRDITGLFSVNNPGGYGGANGIFTENVYKYVLSLKDLNTNMIYKQYYGDDHDYDGEYQNPSVSEIQTGEPVTVDSENFNLDSFKDSLYEVKMSTVMDFPFNGDGFSGQEVVVNVPSSSTIANNFNAIYVDREIYNIVDVVGSNLFLDRPIYSDFDSFYPVLSSSDTIVLSSELFNCIDKKIAKLADCCGCMDVDKINELTKIQLLMWGIDMSVDRSDFYQANEYLNTALKMCSNCCC